MDKILECLKTLTNASGVSGYEGDVRDLMTKYFQGLGAISYDSLGSVIC